MKHLLTLSIVFILYVSSVIILHKTSLSVHNIMFSPRLDERSSIRHAGGVPGYPVISHVRSFTINNKTHSIPSYNTVYDCEGHKIKFLTGSYQNVWQPISSSSDEEVVFEYACFTN